MSKYDPEYSKKWRLAHPEYAYAWRLANAKKLKEYNHSYWESIKADPDRMEEYRTRKRDWARRNREKKNENKIVKQYEEVKAKKKSKK